MTELRRPTTRSSGELTALTPTHLAHLRMAAIDGAERAAVALERLAGVGVSIRVRTVSVARTAELSTMVGDVQAPAAAVTTQLLGHLAGRSVLVLPQYTALRLAELLLHRPVASLDTAGALERSAIREVATVLSSSSLAAIGDALGQILLPSPPSLALDRAHVLVASASAEGRGDREFVLCVDLDAELAPAPERLRALLLLIPDLSSARVMVRALRGR